MHVQLQIDFNNHDNRYIESIDWDALSRTNVSQPELAVMGISRGAKGFQLSADSSNPVSSLDGTNHLFGDSGYPGILTAIMSGSEGEFNANIDVKFYLRGDVTGKLYIVFDEVAQEWATSVRITLSDVDYSVTFTNDSPELVIDLYDHFAGAFESLDGKVCTLSILYWSRPYASVKITSIAIAQKYLLNSGKIQDLTYSENSHDANLSIKPGIVAQYLDANIYDRDGTLHGLASRNMLFDNCKASVQVIEGMSIISSEDYVITSWDVQPLSSIVTLNCEDPSVNFNKVITGVLPPATRTLEEILDWLFSHVPRIKWVYADEDTDSDCRRLQITNSWLLADTLLNHLRKVCSLGMLRIYYYAGTFYVKRCY